MVNRENYFKCFKLQFLAETGMFICICIIVNLSSKDPFESHFIRDINNYFNNIQNQSLYNIKMLDELYKPENPFQNDLNESTDNSTYKYIFKRKLESNSFCEDMRESFTRNEGKKLSYIFDVNYKIIRRLAISLLAVTCTYVMLIIIIILIQTFLNYIKKEDELWMKENQIQINKIQNANSDINMLNDLIIKKEKNVEQKIDEPNKIISPIDIQNTTTENLGVNNLENLNIQKKNNERKIDTPSEKISQISIKKIPNDKEDVNNDNIKPSDKHKKKIKLCKIFGIISGFLALLAWIAKFVLSLILYHFIESGDIEKYNDFLDCRGIKKEFFDNFSDIQKLRKCVLALAILNIISECLDKIGDCPFFMDEKK